MLAIHPLSVCVEQKLTEHLSYLSAIDQPLFLRVYGPTMRYALSLGVGGGSGRGGSREAHARREDLSTALRAAAEL